VCRILLSRVHQYTDSIRLYSLVDTTVYQEQKTEQLPCVFLGGYPYMHPE